MPDNWELLQQLLAEEGIAPSVASRIPQRPLGEPLCLSFAQQRLWTVQQMLGEASSAYNIVVAIRMSGALNTPALQFALNAVIQRHEVLRTSIESHLGQPRLRIL